jgi:undecaprenyl diphosphate synthase
MQLQDIDDKAISDNLTTFDMPDPELLIRTGREQRLSNFLLWQCAYSELYFSEVMWPEFDKEELCKAIYNYQQRQRRFGKTGEQVTK